MMLAAAPNQQQRKQSSAGEEANNATPSRDDTARGGSAPPMKIRHSKRHHIFYYSVVFQKMRLVRYLEVSICLIFLFAKDRNAFECKARRWILLLLFASALSSFLLLRVKSSCTRK